MHKRLLLGLVLFAAGALLSLHAQTPAAPAAMPPGQILAAKVTGNVTMTVGGGASVKLNNNDPVSQHATIVTDKEASVVLVFSNGATTQLGSDTQLVIDEFLQDPFSAAITVADLNEEPTTSRTKLRLTHGELVGNVKHLKHEQGSAFTVETPVGAAGIRGTTFRIVFRPSGTGLAFFSLSTVEGNVAFQQPGASGGGNATGAGNATPADTGAAAGAGTTPGTGTPADAGAGTATTPGTGPGAGTTPGTGGNTGGASTTTGPGGTAGGSSGGGGVAVTGGQEVVLTVNVTVNPTTNVMTVSTPVVVTNTTNISATTMAAVSQQAVSIATTAAAVTFTPTPPATPPASTPPAGDSGSGSSSTNTPSGDSSNSGTGTGGNTGTGTNTNTNTGTNTTTNTNTNTNTGSNLGNTPPPVAPPTPRVTTGDGKSD